VYIWWNQAGGENGIVYRSCPTMEFEAIPPSHLTIY
jgi:hypothetical protein